MHIVFDIKNLLKYEVDKILSQGRKFYELNKINPKGIVKQSVKYQSLTMKEERAMDYFIQSRNIK